jgi:hypothetical protein
MTDLSLRDALRELGNDAITLGGHDRRNVRDYRKPAH